MDNNIAGTIIEGNFTSKIYANATYQYYLYIPKCDISDYEFGLVVNHDGLLPMETEVAVDLAEKGEMPYCIFIGIAAGNVSSTVEGGTDRQLRMNSFDVYSAKFSTFIIDELIPFLTTKYSLCISPSPDMHMVSGGSSGGISAWNIAWHRNDYFKRVYMTSPSFLSMARGDELINLMRKFETKPIRVYTEFSENEPNDYFGDDYCAGESCARALKFSKYDVMDRYYPGEGHCSGAKVRERAYERFRFLWKNWKTESITVKEFSPRVANVVLPENKWESFEGAFPNSKECISCGLFTKKGAYVADGSKIYFIDESGIKTIFADGFDDICAICLSSDKWRLYIADRNRGIIYAATLNPDGSCGGIYTHGVLHLNNDFRLCAIDMCVDCFDRLYVATEIGIQTIRPYGLIDAILVNPEEKAVQKLVLNDDGYLYALCKNNVYRRKLNNKLPPKDDIISTPQNLLYYD
ncbi:MAG: hypothetical protein IKB86_04475 [Clostridia bacterium]|nr:hypothetical protein [Clostridia bacterium]